jgi:hypothetical protein
MGILLMLARPLYYRFSQLIQDLNVINPDQDLQLFASQNFIARFWEELIQDIR